MANPLDGMTQAKWNALRPDERDAIRDNSGLEPRLIGLEGKRVEITLPDGTRERFYVGKSTGWLPCHLEIKRRDSSGGGAVYLPAGATVKVIGR